VKQTRSHPQLLTAWETAFSVFCRWEDCLSPDLPIHFSVPPAYYYSSVSLRFYGVRGLYCWPCLRFRYWFTYNTLPGGYLYDAKPLEWKSKYLIACSEYRRGLGMQCSSYIDSNYSNTCILCPLSVKNVLRISFAWLFPLTQLKCLACIMTMNKQLITVVYVQWTCIVQTAVTEYFSCCLYPTILHVYPRTFLALCL